MSPKKIVWLLRPVALVHLLLLFAQAVLAGQFLTANTFAFEWHRFNGTAVIMSVALAQCILAVLAWRKKVQPLAFVLASVGLYIAEGAQIGVGFSGRMSVHIPLGVLIFGVGLTLALMAFKRIHLDPEVTDEASAGPSSPEPASELP